MDEIQDNMELYDFLAKKAEELEKLLLVFDGTAEWLEKFNAIVEEINDSKIKHRIAPKMEKLVLVEEGTIEEKRVKAEVIVDAVKEQVFMQKRRLTKLGAIDEPTRSPVFYDGWIIEIENRVFRSSFTEEVIKLAPQLGKVFTHFITNTKDGSFYPILTVAEIACISETKSYDTKRVSWNIKQKLNDVLVKMKHYSCKPPIDIADSSGTGDDYAYILHNSDEIKS